MNDKNKKHYPEFTHYLECAHCIGRTRKVYFMRCNVLKTLPGNRLKLEVYGERYWKGKEDVKRVRYTESNRVFKKDRLLGEQQELGV
jgi:hypothetical protein